MKRKFFLVFSFVLFLFHGLLAQNNIKYQALFVYNFTRYIEWPSTSSSEFVIGVVGKSNIYDELQSVTQGKLVGAQSIKVKKIQNINEMGFCNILFISREISSQVPQLASQIKDNTLIITERDGLINKGAGINFIINEGKQKFELSKLNLEKRGLKVNKQLVDMAISND
jgi:hypothetical protein